MILRGQGYEGKQLKIKEKKNLAVGLNEALAHERELVLHGRVHGLPRRVKEG